MTNTLTIDIHDWLEASLPNEIDVPASIQTKELLDFHCSFTEAELDLDELLEKDGRAAILLDTGHVLERRPDLTEAQAKDVLRMARGDFFRDGRHLDFIERTADSMFARRPCRWRVEATLFVDDFDYCPGKVESILRAVQGQITNLGKDLALELKLETLAQEPDAKAEGGAQ